MPADEGRVISAHEGGEGERVGRFEPIDVWMSVTPADDSNCPPTTGDRSSVQQSFNLENGGRRACQMVVSGTDGRPEYVQSDACEECPCYVFSTHDCVAELEEIRDGRLLYSVTIPERSVLAPIVAALRDIGCTVSVTHIFAACESEKDCASLTDKQHETLISAIEMGYYDRPRRATLDDVAERHDITCSAASQRLNSVKRRLIEEYVRKFDSVYVE